MNDQEKTKTEKLFDLEAMRLPMDYGQNAQVRKLIRTIPIKKPVRHEFFRVHPELTYESLVFQDAIDKETYLVDSALWDVLYEELLSKIFFVYINRSSNLKLWPIRLPDEAGKIDNYNQSALDAARIAQERWIRIVANREAGHYDIYEAQGSIPEPIWPDICGQEDALAQIITLAFRERGKIDSMDHPIIRRALDGL